MTLSTNPLIIVITAGMNLGPGILKGPVLAESRVGSVLRVTQGHWTRYC